MPLTSTAYILKNISIHISASYAAGTDVTLLADTAGSQVRFLVKVEVEQLRLLKTAPEASDTGSMGATDQDENTEEQLSPAPEPPQAGLPGHLLITHSPAQGLGSVLLLITTMGI